VELNDDPDLQAFFLIARARQSAHASGASSGKVNNATA
jgi:hypothetical protein